MLEVPVSTVRSQIEAVLSDIGADAEALEVTEVLEVPVSTVRSQIEAVLSDIGADAVKTGLLASPAIIEAVAEKLREYGLANLVVDPVVVAEGEDRLLQEDAVDALRTLLIPLAKVVTPNIPEAEVLTGREIRSIDDARDAARAMVSMGAGAAVVTGGHLEGPATDILFDGEETRAITSPRVTTTSDRGTGCTFASAITAGLAKGLSVREAVAEAKTYVTSSIRHAYVMGRGRGPLNHFF